MADRASRVTHGDIHSWDRMITGMSDATEPPAAPSAPRPAAGGPAPAPTPAPTPAPIPDAAPAPAQVPEDPEDRKLITLARSARARNGVPEGAAVRDETGRTYVAGTVALDSLDLSALRTAVAMAVASGARSLEAAAVVTEAQDAADLDRAAFRDLGGAATPVILAGPDGTVRATVTAG
jgi:hypothetical protein